MNQWPEKMTQDYAFLVPLLGLNYPVFKALQWALNQTSLYETHRMQKFIDFLRRNYGLEERNYYFRTFDYWRIPGKEIHLALTGVERQFDGHLTIYFGTFETSDDKLLDALTLLNFYRIKWITSNDSEETFYCAENGHGSLVYFGKQDFFDQFYQRLASS